MKVCMLLNKMKYARAIYLNFQIIHYHKLQNSFFWTMIQENITCLNEECGELSFSVLSRCVLGDTNKSDFDRLSNMYAMIHVYRNINQDLCDDIQAPLIKRTKRCIRVNSEEVTSTGFYFLSKIRELNSNHFLIYTGTKKSYKRKNNELRVVNQNEVVHSFWLDEVASQIESMSSYCLHHTCGYWLHGFRNIWPEARYQPSPLKPSDIVMEPDHKQGESDDEDFDDMSSGEEDDSGVIVPEEILSDIDLGAEIVNNEEFDLNPDIILDSDDMLDEGLDVPNDQEDEYPEPFHTPPRVFRTMSEQFMRDVEEVSRSPRKRRRTPASHHYSFPFISPSRIPHPPPDL